MGPFDLGAITPQTETKVRDGLAAAHSAGYDVTQLWGYVPTSTPEHSVGRAVDFMVYSDRAMGDWLADYLWTNRTRFRLRWVIWLQRIRSTSPGHSGQWEPMPDRGSPTANHMDHVHVFFDDQEPTRMITGPDVSSHQPSWAPVASDSFVFIKTTEGQTYARTLKDATALNSQISRARAAGLVVGFYHFLWPEYDRQTADGKSNNGTKASGSPEVQARWFVANTPMEPGDLLVVDWEHAGSFAKGQQGGYASYAEKDRFLAEVKRLRPDYKIGLYVNRSMWNASNKLPGDFLWLAEYAKAPTITEPWVFWQYSDHTTSGQSLDQNNARFNTIQELRDWILPPAPEPDYDIEEAIMAMTPEQRKEFAQEIADAILDRDGKIPNTLTGNAKNEFIAPKTAFEFIGRHLAKIEAKLGVK